MAAVDITISGMLYDKINRTTQNVVLIGEATLTGLGVGGGPIVPPESEKPPKPPVGIWPGPGPIYPIEPHPEHPIVLPLPPDKPPGEPPTQPPNVNWEWGWSPAYGWHPVFVAGDKPQPIPPSA